MRGTPRFLPAATSRTAHRIECASVHARPCPSRFQRRPGDHAERAREAGRADCNRIPRVPGEGERYRSPRRRSRANPSTADDARGHRLRALALHDRARAYEHWLLLRAGHARLPRSRPGHRRVPAKSRHCRSCVLGAGRHRAQFRTLGCDGSRRHRDGARSASATTDPAVT